MNGAAERGYTAAMIGNRLVYHAEVLTLTGDSYRTRQRGELLAKEDRASHDQNQTEGSTFPSGKGPTLGELLRPPSDRQRCHHQMIGRNLTRSRSLTVAIGTFKESAAEKGCSLVGARRKRPRVMAVQVSPLRAP